MDTSSSDFLIYDVNYPNSKANTSGEVSQDHVWDRPWPTDQIRQHSHSWSLGGDSGLLNKLHEIAQSLTSQTHLVQKEVNSFSHEVEVTNANLNNINNDFLMLSNCQFVESRVYDEEVSSNDILPEKKENQNKSKEEKENEIISIVSSALKLGISVIDRAYEHLDVQDSDSEGENEPYYHEPILRPKNPYWNRPLPFLIGSQAFYNESKLGIIENFSDDDLPNDVSNTFSSNSLETKEKNLEFEANGEVKEIESYSESSEEEIYNEPVETNQDGDLFSPEESSENISNGDDFLSSTLKTDFNKELSSKLRIPHQEKVTEPIGPARSKALDSTSTNDSNYNKSTDNLFQDIPDEKFTRRSDSISSKGNEMDDDDDDLFGKDGLFSSKKKFDTFQNNNLLKSKKEKEDLNIKPSGIMERKVDFIKKNLDGKASFNDDLFNDDDDDDDDLFATSSIRKADPSQSLFDEKPLSVPDREIIKTTPVGAKSMFGVNVNKLNQQISQHFKNNEIEDNSDFGSGQVSRSTSSASIRDSKKEIPISASNSTLFDDDDDEDNLFSSSSTNISKTKGRPNDNLFNQVVDDNLEDLFAPIATASKYTSSNSISSAPFQADKISITKSESSSNFDEDQDDLFSQETSAKQPNFSFLSDTKTTSSTLESSKNSAQLYNDFAQSDKSALPKSLFDDDDNFDDLFKTDSKKGSKSESKSLLVKSEPKSLFSDDDVDLFGPSTSGVSDINLFGSAKITKMKDEKKKPISISDVAVNKTTTKVTDDIKVAVKLEENNEADGLFVVSAKVDKTVAPTATVKKTASGDKISKLRSELENQLGDKFGSADAGSSPFPRKKIIGGQSILGPGMVPNLLKPRSPSHAQREISESLAKQNTTSEENLNKSPERSISGDQLVKGESVSFDAPVDTNVLLHNANKERAKIQVKRRPQTRKARHETIRNSTIVDSVVSESLFTSDPQVSSVSAPTSPTPETNLKPNIPTIPIKTVKMDADKTPNLSILSPSTDEDDLFIVDSRQPTIPPLEKNLKTAQINLPTPKHRSSKENLFGESSDEGDSEELFLPKSSKMNTVDTMEKASNSSRKNSDTPSFDFTPKNRSSKVEVKTRDYDLFGNAENSDAIATAQVEPKVQALPIKSIQKTPAASKSKAQSLFDDDDDDDDLFKTISSASKSKSTNKNQSTTAKSKSLFDDEVDNDLFEDPLMAKKQ